MTISAVTLTDGSDATVPSGTSVALMPSTAGNITTIVPAYAATSGDAPTPLADENGVIVQGTTQITDLTVATTNATVSIGDATSSTEVIAANSSRKGWALTNMSSAVCYVKFGTAASATSFHARLAQYDRIGQRIMDGDLYTGVIHAIWASDAGGTINGGDW
jgi:hypothetical protein